MSSALREPLTLSEFLAWEERQELRWEFDGFAPVAMTGGTDAHEGIGTRLRTLLDMRLMGKRCHVRGPTMKIEVVGRVRYPDAVVSCTPGPRESTIIRDPVVIFEVLSPSTSRIDRIVKLREYQATESVQRYVILEPDSIAATVIFRRGEDWIVRSLIDGDTMEMPEIDVTIPLSDIYADIELAPSEPGEISSTAMG
jgi:Uma2 family endonuclease